MTCRRPRAPESGSRGCRRVGRGSRDTRNARMPKRVCRTCRGGRGGGARRRPPSCQAKRVWARGDCREAVAPPILPPRVPVRARRCRRAPHVPGVPWVRRRRRQFRGDRQRIAGRRPRAGRGRHPSRRARGAEGAAERAGPGGENRRSRCGRRARDRHGYTRPDRRQIAVAGKRLARRAPARRLGGRRRPVARGRPRTRTFRWLWFTLAFALSD